MDHIHMIVFAPLKALELDNVQTLCVTCHKAKSAYEREQPFMDKLSHYYGARTSRTEPRQEHQPGTPRMHTTISPTPRRASAPRRG